MHRTQVYLTKLERDRLTAIAKAGGKKQSELIREAVDQFCDFAMGERREAVLREAAGMWRGRTDLPDFSAVRDSWDRG